MKYRIREGSIVWHLINVIGFVVAVGVVWLWLVAFSGLCTAMGVI